MVLEEDEVRTDDADVYMDRMMVSSLLGLWYRIWIDGRAVMLWHGFVVQGCV